MFFYKIPYNIILIFSILFIPTSVLSGEKRVLKVTATAYNSVKGQTDKTPNLAAWNNKLIPGMKTIAVSRDLLKVGLTNGVQVKISGLSGTYIVRDKMNKRWREKIDIYMGIDIQAARNWGNFLFGGGG